MGKFLLKLLLLLAVVAGVSGWFEVKLRGTLNSYTEKTSKFALKKSEIGILVVGPSTANQGIQPSKFGAPAFNLASPGQDLFYDAAIIRGHLAAMPELRLVILPLSYASLEYAFPGTPEYWRMFCYSVYCGLPLESPSLVLDPRAHSAFALVGPLEALKMLPIGFKGGPAMLDEDGFQGVLPPPKEEVELMINDLTARKRLNYYHSIMRPENMPGNLAILDGLLTTLKSRSIQAVFVTLPVFVSYSSNADPVRLMRLRKGIGDLSKTHQVPYLDYFEDRRFALEDFADNEHLCRAGAAKFSVLLWKDLLARHLFSPLKERHE